MYQFNLRSGLIVCALLAMGAVGCTVDTTPTGSTCKISGESCTSSLSCCGPGLCTSGGTCDTNSYLSAGSSCSRSIECRGTLFCTSGRCQ